VNRIGASQTAGEYFYVQDDYTVTASIFLGEKVAFQDVTEEWKEFCRNRLQFEVPVKFRLD